MPIWNLEPLLHQQWAAQALTIDLTEAAMCFSAEQIEGGGVYGQVRAQGAVSAHVAVRQLQEQ